MSARVDEQKVDELLSRGVSEVLVKENLRKKLISGNKLRVKLGIDPTSPHLHLGRTVPLLKLRDFQELGHQIVLVVGDFTGVIGDTSDKESERPMLDSEVIAENMKTYAEQAGKLLDMDTVEVRHNSEWLSSLTYKEIGEHADLFSVADFTARENIRRRLDEGKRVSLRELLYPLMQGYDSVVLKADVELGGTDQKFNVLAARPLQEHFGQEPQDVILNPLINGLDGRKMSSSWGNTVALTDAPDEMYGKIMSLRDEDILTYFTLCTRVSLSDISDIKKEIAGGGNPRDAKMLLAREIVTLYHDGSAADAAEQRFVETFQKGGIPEEVIEIKREGEETFPDALIRLGVVASKSELRRLFEGGGVRNTDTDEKLEEIDESLIEPTTLKIGKRRFVKLLP